MSMIYNWDGMTPTAGTVAANMLAFYTRIIIDAQALQIREQRDRHAGALVVLSECLP